MRSDTILVPVDFSDCSRLLVAEAARLAQRLGAGVTLIHVVNSPEGLSVDTPIQPGEANGTTTVGRYLVDAAWKRMPAYAEVVKSAGVPVESVVEVGDPADRILDHQAHHGMIVMGTHGRRGFARMMMGSVAEQITRQAMLPVMTVRTEHRPDCEARSCEWCASHVMPQELEASVEQDG